MKMAKNKAFVSVICPIYNEETYIAKCIETMLQQDYPQDQLEFLFVDGNSKDKTREIVLDYSKDYTNIKLLNNPHQYVPQALNIAIKESKGDVIIRIDGHCEYPTNYISVLVKYLYELNADNVGGVWNTIPSKGLPVNQAIAIASSHIFGVGNSRHKIGSREISQTDTVPFGCYKREVFDKIGLFDEELIRNQDDEFNARLIMNGGKIFLIPEIVIDYYARDTISQMSKMYYQYGLFKPLVNKKIGKPATIRQFFPMLFFIGLIGGLILSLFSSLIFAIYISTLVLYVLIGVIIGLQNIKTKKDYKFIYLMPYVFFITHISYGWGYVKGIYKVLRDSSFVVNSSR